jgi:exosortase D (VPLPA-CTERM-specific)
MSTQSLKLTSDSAVRAAIPLVFVALVSVIISVFVFSGALAALVDRFTRYEEYSHGFLIPLVSIWLLWTRRDALAASIGRPSWAGLGLILFAICMHIIGELSSIVILSQVAFILTLIGIVLAIGGYPLLRVTFIPIAFLFFAIPLPYFIDVSLTLQLQLLSSQLGAWLIRLAGIPVYLEGNVIDLGIYKLMVVEACSGLRYLFPLLSLGFLAAYLFRAPIWQRAVVFLSAIPITIGMNSFRIGLIGVMANYWGIPAAYGVLHYFEGWIIFIACAGILVAEIFLLARLSGKSFSQVFDLPTVEPSLPSGGRTMALAGYRPIAACLVMLAVTGVAVYLISGRSEIVPERSRFAAFPMRIGQWQGYPSEVDTETQRALRFDDYILSDYVRPNGAPVNLYVAYYASQRKGGTHSPSVCLPGGGWLMTSFERTNYADLSTQLPFNRVIMDQGANKQLVYYWFEERSKKVADEWWAKWYLLTDAITMNRTDGALVRLVTSIRPGETEADADARLHAFMQELLPRLATYLPARPPTQARAASYMPRGH